MKKSMSSRGCYHYTVKGWFEIYMINLDSKYTSPDMILINNDFKSILCSSYQSIIIANYWGKKFDIIHLDQIVNNPLYIKLTKRLLEVDCDNQVIVQKKDREGNNHNGSKRGPEINKRKDYEKRSDGELIYCESSKCWFLKEDGKFKYVGKSMREKFPHLTA